MIFYNISIFLQKIMTKMIKLVVKRSSKRIVEIRILRVLIKKSLTILKSYSIILLNNVQIWRVFMKVTKDAIIDEAIAILEEKGDDPQKLTIRELAGRLGIGVGLVNYHFGSKEVLVNRCVKKMIMSIVEEFHKVRTSLAYMKPKEKLNYLCLMTFDYLYTKPNVSKVALIYDLGNTSNDDTTSELIDAYIPIVKDCKPSYDDQKAYLIASRVIYIIEQSFLRTDVIRLRSGVDLSNSEERKEYLENLLKDMMK